jgi:hypothetical protein
MEAKAKTKPRNAEIVNFFVRRVFFFVVVGFLRFSTARETRKKKFALL